MRKKKIYFGLILSMLVIILINSRDFINVVADGTVISDT